ncbi:hypothetical protein APHAL10511_006576 [Amanita phalloides]|nr:hypothetical protein APHAL10511_006576 [Amanita phalloides]
MVKDIIRMRSCWILFVSYFIIQFLLSILPATEIWYSGQLLSIVQMTLDERKIDENRIVQIIIGTLLCSVSRHFLLLGLTAVQEPLSKRIQQFYTIHYFNALARLDLPTFEDVAVQRQLETALPRTSKRSTTWELITTVSDASFQGITLISKITVLIGIVKDQHDGLLLVVLSFIHPIMRYSWQRRRGNLTSVWAATSKDPCYIRTQGLKQTVNNPIHRKEMVVGNMWKYMLAQYTQCIQSVADHAGDFHDMLMTRDIWKVGSIINSLILESLPHLPQIVFMLRAVRYPASVPIIFASLNLITKTTNDFIFTIYFLFERDESILNKITSIRNLYQIIEIPNKVFDGKVPFPENQRSLETGMSIEFRNVSFIYPDTDTYALRDVSFKVDRGQLCVIIGVNGSGKSTILKLIARIYDVTEGQILVDGVDIKTLRLDDLRRSMSVLFQDYTHFPLSIRDNIGLGNTDYADDDEKIMEAARLGGADGIIHNLPEGLDTYLERPVKEYYSNLTEGTIVHGRRVDYSHIRHQAGMDSSTSRTLSGGQLQRIALSRTFMRSLSSEAVVGLLIFDEPSASLDPTAEHELFERLQQLRVHKTMIFSSHRFGNLTRSADMILYLNNSVIMERGSHEQLLQKDGEYARIWKLQAQAFA